jgi:iron complex outermembrane receptor protein
MFSELHFVSAFAIHLKIRGYSIMSKNLYKTIAASVFLMFGIMALSSTALAQSGADDMSDDAVDEELLEEVIVTGSILKRSDDQPSPVTIMTDDWMQDAGLNTISEAMQRMPANNAGTITNNWNVGFNFATGATAPALRGLTVQDTLSIMDGLRMAPYPLADDGQRNFVDLNTIPNNVVSRIEVLRDGASSTYGADAIAGVVNVITKKEIQGTHIGVSYGWAQHGAGEEPRLDIAWGFGDLETDGQNFYIAGEYMKMEAVWASDRSAPFDTGDWTTQCGSTGSCMANLNWNGITAEDTSTSPAGAWNGFFASPGISFTRPVAEDATSGFGRFEMLNPDAGCRDLPTVNVAPDQSTTSPAVNCEIDFRDLYRQLQPEIERKGISMRYTANVNDDTQFYAMANYYLTDTIASTTPLNFHGTPTPPRAADVTIYRVLLPVYTCRDGVGTQSGYDTGCNADNGALNPYNLYAEDGMRSQVLLRNPNPRIIKTESRAYRLAFGFDGAFADDYRYTANFTASEVGLTRNNQNNMIPQRIMNVAATGEFNFYDPSANSQETWDYIAPELSIYSVSRLWQVQGTIAKDLMELSGGPLQAAVGLAYRFEEINAPSGNPANLDAEYSRYYGINAVGTAGSRNVSSAFFEVDAPFTETFDMVFSGRYDDYSSGQSSFSPKVGLKWEPLDAIVLRGTASQGFRIPSFNEAFGLPTTGYVTRTVDCTVYTDYCDAHDNNAYATQAYNLGLTQVGDPELDPEESTSYTIGAIWQVTDNFQMTIDFWQIEVENLISGVTDTSEAENQYFLNDGVVNIPGMRVLEGTPDVAFPNALPSLGFIQTAYTNQDSQKVSGIDFAARYNMPLGSVDWVSSISVSYLDKFTLTTDAGDELEYAGTLSPCNITSCSGAPEWRGYWMNTFQFTEQWTASFTMYYTSGVDTASIDFGGVKGDCQANADIGASTSSYVDGSPVQCKTKAQFNSDLTVQYQVNEKWQMYADILNAFDTDPQFDPASAYGLYGFNPAWAGPNIMGRYFRLGVRMDF